MRRSFIYLSAGFFTMAGLAIAGLEVLTRLNVDPVIAGHIEIQKRHIDKYFEDQSVLRELPLQERVAGASRDAGPFLNPRLRWMLVENSENRPSLILPPALREKVLNLRGHWIRHHQRLKEIRTDLSFFAKIEEFDHWDLERFSPIAALIEARRPVPGDELPIPDSVDLAVYAKLRLMYAAQDGDALEGLRQVRHLARLLFSTENLHMQMTALSILKLERTAFRYYLEKKVLGPEAWTVASKDITLRAARALLATKGYLRLWTPPELLERIYLSPTQPLGYCAALNESLPAEFAFRSYLGGYWPFERDYREEFYRLERILQVGQSHCRLRYLRAVSDRGLPEKNLPVIWPLNRLPYTRKLFGLKSTSLTMPGFDSYTDHESVPRSPGSEP